jgi:hypothetical protein
VYTRRRLANNGLDSNGPETVWVATSHDAGATWTSNLVASMPTPASYLYPAIAMDAGGALHVVYASKTDEDRPIWYSSSSDQARTWSEPIALTHGDSGFSPWVAAGAPGEVAVVWYGSPNPAVSLSSDKEDWYLYWARLSDGAVTGTGTTTTVPIYHGAQGQAPEFNQVRLGADGKMRIGASALSGSGGSGTWVTYYQTEL